MTIKLLGLLALTAVAATNAGRAQTTTVNWSAFTGGGGTSTAGVYRLTSTLSQPAPGRLNSSDFTIDGGVWSIAAAVQEPGAPKLSVRYTRTNTVVISWPMTWPGFSLQEKSDLPNANWASAVPAPAIVVTAQQEAHKQAVVPMQIGKRFYRLKKSLGQ